MLELPKSNGPFEAGTWRRAIAGDKVIAIFICPNCGSAADINRECGNHSIGPDGTVNPSVICGAPGCSFHEFIKLKDW